jgi:hypothetical protein
MGWVEAREIVYNHAQTLSEREREREREREFSAFVSKLICFKLRLVEFINLYFSYKSTE